MAIKTEDLLTKYQQALDMASKMKFENETERALAALSLTGPLNLTALMEIRDSIDRLTTTLDNLTIMDHRK